MVALEQLPHLGTGKRDVDSSAAGLPGPDPQLGPPDHCRLVDPVPGQGLGQDVPGRLLALGDHEGVVAVPPTGHGDVHASGVGRSVEEQERAVHRAALLAWLVWA